MTESIDIAGRYALAERLLPDNWNNLVFRDEVQPHWVKGGDAFWYRVRTREGYEFVLVDAVEGSRKPAFDHERLAKSLETDSSNSLPFESIDFADDMAAIEFEFGERRWRCRLDSYACEDIGEAQSPAEDTVRSPDKRRDSFIRDYNVVVRERTTEREVALTSDGEADYGYGAAPFLGRGTIMARQAGKPSPACILWSPDSQFLLTIRLDERRVARAHFVQIVPPDGSHRPILHSIPYSLAGDEHIPMCELAVFDVEKGTRLDLDFEPFVAFHVVLTQMADFQWSPDGTKLYIITRARGEREVALHEVDIATGKLRMLMSESGDSYVELAPRLDGAPNVRVFGNGKEVLWYSERDGWAHLYLRDAQTGNLRSQVTSGQWRVRGIVHVDEAERRVYFTANAREDEGDPYLVHLYRIRLDGSDLELLTSENGEHVVSMSPDGRFIVDTWSRVFQPQATVLRSADGKVVVPLEQADADAVTKGWTPPEWFKAKAADSVADIYGVIYRPSHFDPSQSYPVLDCIYPGPQTLGVPERTFAPDGYGHAFSIAELGFVIVKVDGRGSPLMSKAHHDYSTGQLEDCGSLEDHVAAIRQLGERYPYLDMERVGIYGHSGGGFASTRALLVHGDFYKDGVRSGVTPSTS